jgi:hypothetical protein
LPVEPEIQEKFVEWFHRDLLERLRTYPCGKVLTPRVLLHGVYDGELFLSVVPGNITMAVALHLEADVDAEIPFHLNFQAGLLPNQSTIPHSRLPLPLQDRDPVRLLRMITGHAAAMIDAAWDGRDGG